MSSTSSSYSSAVPRRPSFQRPHELPSLIVEEPEVYSGSLPLSAGPYTNYTTSSMFPPRQPLRPTHSPLLTTNTFSTYPPISPPGPMDRWYGQLSEEPWNIGRSTSNYLPTSSYIGPSFNHTRSKAGSDSESIITTHTTPPTAPSVYSADEPMTGYQDSLQVEPDMASMNLTLRRTSSRASSTLEVPSTTHRAGAGQKTKILLKCKYCGQDTKTKSELKKHRLKHERPFKCPVVTCDRNAGGFTTSNDLERHKRSKHKIFDGDDVKVYKCGSHSCADKSKLWYRLDNFCQHLDRMHQGEEKEDLVKRSEMRWNAGDSQDVEKAPEPVDDNQDPMDAPIVNMMTGMGGIFAPNPLYNYHDPPMDPTDLEPTGSEVDIRLDPGNWSELNYGMNQVPNGSNSNPKDFSNSTPTRKPEVVLHPAEDALQGQIRAGNWIDIAIANGCDLNSLMDTIKSKLQDDPSHAYAPLYGKYQAGDTTTRSTELTSGSKSIQPKGSVSKSSERSSSGSTHSLPKISNGPNITVSEDKSLRCKYCSKELPRSSALKKHQKRHERLYGCTFESCAKTFGSKDDWKRHENSQHFQVDTWRCGEMIRVVDYNGGNERPCSKLFHRKEIFSEHLKRTHGITDKAKITEECTKRHVGCNSQGTYWCGFCREIKNLSTTGGKAWDERFDHIGGHFSEERRNITDWLAQGQGPFTSSNNQEAQDDASEDLDNEEYDDDTAPGPPPTPPPVQSMAPPSFIDPRDIGINNPSQLSSILGSSPSAAKRPRIDHHHQSAPIVEQQHHQQQHQHQQYQPAHHQHMVEESSRPNNGFYCCQCSMGPFYEDLHVQCVGYGTCSHIFCEEGCGVRRPKRQKSHSSAAGRLVVSV